MQLNMKYAQFFFVCIMLLAIKVKQTSQYIQEKTMEDTYDTKINLHNPRRGSASSLILKSHSGSYGYITNRNKTLVISADPAYGLFAAVKLLDLRPNRQDYLSVIGGTNRFNYSNSNFLIKSRNVYPNEDIYKVYAPDGEITVTFMTGRSNPSTYNYDGFEMIFTVQANWIDCMFDVFHCDNGRCIADALKCDGHNHCEDRSDQKYCDSTATTDKTVTTTDKRFITTYKTGRSTGWIIGGVFFAVIGLICAVYIMMRRLARSSTTEEVISHPPPISSYPPSYPPSYPAPPSYPQGYPAPPPPYSQGINNPGYH